MAPNIVSIGPIALHQFEIPESIRFGGRYRVALHLLAGGGRVLEQLGPEEDEIDFEGAFSGPSAIQRARSVDLLRLTGEPIWLIWPAFARQVIITAFVADFRSPSWIPYHITCTAVVQPIPAVALVANIATLISGDMNAAVDASIGTAVSLASLQTALAAPNAFVVGSTDHAAAVATVSGVMSALDPCVEQQSAVLATVVTGTLGTQCLSGALLTATAAAGTLAAAVNTRSYVGRMSTNLLSLGS